jgi:hypothetical protein
MVLAPVIIGIHRFENHTSVCGKNRDSNPVPVILVLAFVND